MTTRMQKSTVGYRPPPVLGFSRLSSILLWFSGLVFAFHPATAEGARQASPKSVISKSQPRKSVKAPVQRLLNHEKPVPISDALDIREHVVYRASRNENLLAILNRFRLPAAEKRLWGRALESRGGKKWLPRGQEVHFYFSQGGNPGNRAGAQLMAVETDKNDFTSLNWEKSGPAILFQEVAKVFDVEVHTLTGVIEDSFFADGKKAGVHPALLSQMADIFTWDVNFESDLAQGDTYRILFEKRTRKGKKSTVSLRVLAAELVNVGQKFTAIYFEKEKGRGGYYDLDGRSLARSFLRFPVEFASITSQFTMSRFHPILRTRVAHTGVDFAAERGTPVRAIGDGRITLAAWYGFYGKTVDLQHGERYLSRYAHLDRFADGVAPGSEVKKGQVIGYVGSTGRSTGPHLHFELYKDQQYINPLSIDMPAEDVIEPSLQRVFDNQKSMYLVELSSAPQS